MMLGLYLDGRPVALKCSLRSGVGSFGFKIAFDEDFAHFSPGLQLEIENIRRFHGISDLHWMDSCASYDAVLFNRLYLERRTLRTVLLSSGSRVGDFVVSALPLLRWVSACAAAAQRCACARLPSYRTGAARESPAIAELTG